MKEYNYKAIYSIFLLILALIILLIGYLPVYLSGHRQLILFSSLLAPIAFISISIHQLKNGKLNRIIIEKENFTIENQKGWVSEKNRINWGEIKSIKYDGRKCFSNILTIISQYKCISIKLDYYKNSKELLAIIIEKSKQHKYYIDKNIDTLFSNMK